MSETTTMPRNASIALSGVLAVALIAAMATREEQTAQQPEDIAQEETGAETPPPAVDMAENEETAPAVALLEIGLPPPPPEATEQPLSEPAQPIAPDGSEPEIAEAEAPEPLEEPKPEIAEAEAPEPVEEPEPEITEPEIAEAEAPAPVEAPEPELTEPETVEAPRLDDVVAELDALDEREEMAETGPPAEETAVEDTSEETAEPLPDPRAIADQIFASLAGMDEPERAPQREPAPSGTVEPQKVERIESVRPETRKPAAPPAQAVKVDRKTERSGRALLQLLENGVGPSIEIAWPSTRSERERLADLLTRCHGMTPAMLRQDGGTYTLDSPPGRTEMVDLDRLSGFVRQPSGNLTDVERRIVRSLEQRHGGMPANYVRLFNRRVDAALLGGLSQLIGPGYRRSGNITAHYGIEPGAVVVDRIAVDGQPVDGKIALPKAGACAV